MRGRKEEMASLRPRAGVPLSTGTSQACTLKQRPLPATYQWGLVVHVNHGVLQRRKPKQRTQNSTTKNPKNAWRAFMLASWGHKMTQWHGHLSHVGIFIKMSSAVLQRMVSHPTHGSAASHQRFLLLPQPLVIFHHLLLLLVQDLPHLESLSLP